MLIDGSIGLLDMRISVPIPLSAPGMP